MANGALSMPTDGMTAITAYFMAALQWHLARS
jgi:hypothetical protein